MKSVHVLGAVSALFASTTSVSATTSPASSTATEACALASSAWAAAVSANPSTVPQIPASLAYDCLETVPLHKDMAVQLVDAIEPYLEWQSDAAYKADPPTDYFYPPYDMFGALKDIRSNLVGNVYKSEYAFQLDLYIKVFGQGHDGHFVFYPDLLTKVFDFGRRRSLVSISEDGTSLPVIKVYEDVVSSPSTASEVVLINGVNATTYIENVIFQASFNQDADAAYNSMFYAKAVFGAYEGSGYFSGGGRIRFVYQGPNTTFTFANGTVVTFENVANVRSSLTGITDGESMFTAFCNGAYEFAASPSAAPSATASSSQSASSATASPQTKAGGVTVPGFPEPVDITDDAIVSCYFLDGTGFSDVAVLSLLAFESESPSEFQAVTSNCIAQARAAGKTKLVVDLSGNGGGYILQGYDFFRQLFPQILQDGFSRWKANDAFVAIAQIFSDAVKNIDPYTSNNGTLVSEYETWFNYRYDLNLTNQPFETFEDKFGPFVYKDTNYTALMRWNLSDPLTTTNSTYGMGMEISGYGTLANLNQPFAAEDIILLYDGQCASTCTLASEMLRIQAGVRSIAMGGRPQEGAIQGVGGIKGSQTIAFSDLFGYVTRALRQVQDDEQRTALARYNDLPILRSSAAALNVRDQILRDNVKEGLPAQYVVEKSDCRLYWTAEMATDVTAVWKAAAHAAFNGGSCAAGDLSGSKGGYGSVKDRSAVTATGVNEASLARRKAVAARKAEERRNIDSSKDMERFRAMFNQKAVE